MRFYLPVAWRAARLRPLGRNCYITVASTVVGATIHRQYERVVGRQQSTPSYACTARQHYHRRLAIAARITAIYASASHTYVCRQSSAQWNRPLAGVAGISWKLGRVHCEPSAISNQCIQYTLRGPAHHTASFT